ncbi:MAG: DUF5665 domain-containing protein, partial [Pseudomonadota bacterium]
MPSDKTDPLAEEIAALRQEVARLNGHRFVTMHNSMVRLLAFTFARGLALGLGTVVGGGLLLSIVAWSLAQIDFIPIIGDWATQIAT